jgi:hypothetical protein
VEFKENEYNRCEDIKAQIVNVTTIAGFKDVIAYDRGIG